MKRIYLMFFFIGINLCLTYGQDSIFYFSNSGIKGMYGGNEDGIIVPAIYEIELPYQPSQFFHTPHEQLIIMPDGCILYITQETSPTQKYSLYDFVNVLESFGVDTLTEQFERFDEDKIIQLYIKGNFVILMICQKYPEHASFLKSIETFKVIEPKKVIPFQDLKDEDIGIKP